MKRKMLIVTLGAIGLAVAATCAAQSVSKMSRLSKVVLAKTASASTPMEPI